ncbi:MAG: ion transporter [Bacteroidia bacterium]|nr:ion transporter [Bacteroidia bacterium]
MQNPKNISKSRQLKNDLFEIIFGWETPRGKLFDILLLILIVLSIILVMLESVPALDEKYHTFFVISEWVITVLFTIEYALRLYCSPRPKNYATSFFGVVDFVSILPSYLSLFLVNTQALSIVRSLRLMRAFRIFQMTRYTSQGFYLLVALKNSFAKIIVFLVFVLIFTSIIGAIMYVVEGSEPDTGFDSIPRSLYWAITTLSTVGYGDIAPSTALGQTLAAIVMILGYSVIAVPTGILSAEMVKGKKGPPSVKEIIVCPNCESSKHFKHATFCQDCGHLLP